MGGGGGKSGPKEPSAKDYYKQAEGYWANYDKWSQDEQSRYDRDLARQSAQMAAGGSGQDSPMMQKYAEGRKAEYEEAMENLQKGEHGTFLKSYYEKAKKNTRILNKEKERRATLNGRPEDDYVGGMGPMFARKQMGNIAFKGDVENMSMQEFYEAQFGRANGGPGDKEQEALDRAKKAGSGRKGGAGGGDKTSSTLAGQLLGSPSKMEKSSWWG